MPSSITEPTASISLPPKPLPPSRAPSLVLTHPTRVEQTRIANLNGVKWRGALSLPAYHRREDHLGAQLLTRNAGITHWILVDTAEKVPAGSERTVLASCESIRKRALVGYTVTGSSSRTVLRDVVSHGIGSVFCAEKLRGRGYAGRMMQELGKRLETWQLEKGVPGREECLFTVLYSDIGKAGSILLFIEIPADGVLDRNTTRHMDGILFRPVISRCSRYLSFRTYPVCHHPRLSTLLR